MRKTDQRKWAITWAGVAVVVLHGIALSEILPTGRPQPLFADATFPVSPHGRILALPTGKTFHMVTDLRSQDKTIRTDRGPMRFGDLPWVKESIIRVRYGELQNPEVYRNLLEEKTNPIMFFGEGAWMEPHKYAPGAPANDHTHLKFILQMQERFGARFLALDYGEWSWGGVAAQAAYLKRSCDEIFRIPYPTNRDEGAAWWNRDFDLTFRKYLDGGVPVYSFNATCLGHYEGRNRVAFIGNEIGNGIECAPMQIAFCRGASRQFKIPWAIYAASNGWGGGETSYDTFIRPDERRATHNPAWYSGPWTGHTLSMQKRYLYTSYMAGAGFYQRENYRSMAGYDHATVDDTPPRILALQDKSRYPSPISMFYGDFYDRIVKGHDRGTPYAPVALMFDRNHGFVPQYNATHAVGNVPYTAADEQMRAITNTLFPWEGKAPNVRQTIVTGPFGDIFDAITTEASAQTIGGYRAIVLVGEARVDAALAEALRQFVHEGGLLFMVCEQMTPALWELAGITATGDMGQDSSYTRASDFYTWFQEPFAYHEVRLNGAEPLFLANQYENRTWPVATLNRVGRGCVVVGTPVWLAVQGDVTRMHSLFSEIMTMIADELVPVRVYGDDVEVLYNRNENGWVVTLINNEGVIRNWPGYRPATRKFDAAGVILEPRFEYTGTVEWVIGEPLGEDLALVVPPGEVRIVEFNLQ